MGITRKVVNWGVISKSHQLRNRQPLMKITYGVLEENAAQALSAFQDIICDELNVKAVIYTDPTSLANIYVKPQFRVMGKAFGKRMKEMQQKIENLTPEQCQIVRKQPSYLAKIH